MNNVNFRWSCDLICESTRWNGFEMKPKTTKNLPRACICSNFNTCDCLIDFNRQYVKLHNKMVSSYIYGRCVFGSRSVLDNVIPTDLQVCRGWHSIFGHQQPRQPFVVKYCVVLLLQLSLLLSLQ